MYVNGMSQEIVRLDLKINLLLDLVRDEGASLLYVTHSGDLARKADTAWNLTDGHLITDDHSGART